MNKPIYAAIIIFTIVTILFYPVLIHTTAITGNYGDIYKHYYPMKYLVSEHIISGKMPLWNPYIFTGQPLLANPQSSVFYPLSVFFYILPLAPAFVYFQLLHFAMAGIFLFILLKYYRYSDSSSITGAITLCMSSFLVYKIPSGHPMALSGYVWLPLIALFSEKLIKYGNTNSVILFCLALVFQFLSGHTFPLFNSIIFLVTFMLFYLPKNYKYYFSAFAAAICISAIQLLPSYELSQCSENGNLLGLVKNYSLPLSSLITFVLPGHFGKVINGNFIFNSLPSYFFEKECLYIGLLPLIFAIIGMYLAIKNKKYFYPLLFICGLGFAIGFQNPIFTVFYKYMPGFEFLRVPARFVYLSIFSLTILCVYFLNKISKNTDWLIKFIIFLLIVSDLFGWGHKFINAEGMSGYNKKIDLSATINPLYRVITEPEMVIANKSMLYHHFNLNGYEAIFLRDFTRYLGMQEKQALSSTGLCRTDLSSPLSKAFSVKYLITPEFHNELKLITSTNNKLNVYVYANALPRIYFARSFKIFDNDDVAGQLDYLSLTSLTPDKELFLMKDNRQAAYPKDFMLYNNMGKLISYRCLSDKVITEFVLPKPATLVFSDVFYNGWKAASASNRFCLIRGQKVFRAVFVPSGDYIGNNRLILYYQPVSFLLGLFLTVFSVVFIACYYTAVGLKRKIQ